MMEYPWFSDSELIEITGYRHKSKQVAWFKKRGVLCRISAKGHARVLRHHYEKRMGSRIHYANRRRATQLKSIPKWADLDAIEEIYIEAKRISKKTKIKHHVDHIVPLQGANVCGLHVEYNLNIIPASENFLKSNKHENL